MSEDVDQPARADQSLFSTVQREPTLSNKVADLLLEVILSQRLRAGDKLPSERDLASQFGVSRTVVREAVRSLAAKGVIEVRSGSGLRVAAVDRAAVSESLMLFLRGRGPVDYDQIHEVREMLEVQIAAVASRQATAGDLDELVRVHERMEAAADEPEEAAVADVEFHRTIASITHNELYVIMLDSIGDLLLEVRRATVGLPGRPRKALAYHAEILRRIRDRDEEGARRAMHAHLEESVEVWREIESGQHLTAG